MRTQRFSLHGHVSVAPRCPHRLSGYLREFSQSMGSKAGIMFFDHGFVYVEKFKTMRVLAIVSHVIDALQQ
jgi:hypothetical protein